MQLWAKFEDEDDILLSGLKWFAHSDSSCPFTLERKIIFSDGGTFQARKFPSLNQGEPGLRAADMKLVSGFGISVYANICIPSDYNEMCPLEVFSLEGTFQA